MSPRIFDDWGLRYPGVKHVEHVYSYRVAAADKATLQCYHDRGYQLGREYAPA